MRYAAVGSLVAAAFGIHCSAPPADGDGTSTADVVSPEPTRPAPKPTLLPAPEEARLSASKTSVPGLEALVSAGMPPNVTSTVVDETGSEYVTGTFVGTIVIANNVLTSRG